MYEYESTNSSVVMFVDMYSRGPWFEPSNVVLTAYLAILVQESFKYTSNVLGQDFAKTPSSILDVALLNNA